MSKDEPRDILDLLDNATEGECCLFEPAAAEIRRLRVEAAEPADANALVRWLHEAWQSRSIVITASPYEADRPVAGKDPRDVAFRFCLRGPVGERLVATTIVRDWATMNDRAIVTEEMVRMTRKSFAKFVQEQTCDE
jgi:hypothetical protein